ncbi:MAG: hypothetical protein VKJ06_07765 [Vampirovibrionales bacterium]|nr:hypothetical protein [Vampirovibrionales bacterium]
MAFADLLLFQVDRIEADFETILRDHLNDAEALMKHSMRLFDDLQRFLAADKSVADKASAMPATQADNADYAPFANAYEQLQAAHEDIIMIHVNEPGGQYARQIELMRRHFSAFRSPAYQAYLCDLQTRLNDAQEAELLEAMGALQPSGAGQG